MLARHDHDSILNMQFQCVAQGTIAAQSSEPFVCLGRGVQSTTVLLLGPVLYAAILYFMVEGTEYEGFSDLLWTMVIIY